MKYDNWFERVGDGLLGGIIAAVILLCYVFSCIGCASTTPCPPCVPEIETITVNVPTLACPAFEPLPTLTYPSWPEVPLVASEGAYKAFYADVVATLSARERILLGRISALELILDTYKAEDVVR